MTELKKIFFIFLSFIFFFASCEKKEVLLRDGTFIGKSDGRNGPIEVAVTIKDGKVADAEIVNDCETPEIAETAKKAIISNFLKAGNTDSLDAVSGATVTSNALLDAIDEALAISQGTKKAAIIYKDCEYDIVIIGSGGAGLTAATEAAGKGAKVLVLEKMGIIGGNTNYSTGGINASYTKEQQRLGIKDSKEVFFNDTMKGGQYLNDPELVTTLVEKSSDIVEWLQSPIIGADLSDVGMFGGATNKRIHRPKGGQAIGAHLVPLLQKAALNQGAEIRLNNKATDILSDNGKVCGVKVAYESGEYTVHTKAVIVATGGFGANPEMVELYQPSLAGFATTNHKGATGDAFAMVEKFDAQLIQMDQIQTHPTVAKGSGIMITEAVRGNGAILVNKNGRRFVNEMKTRDIVSAAILKCPEKVAYLIFDQGVRDSLKAIETYSKQNLLSQGANLTELARVISIDAVTLEYTINEYNKAVLAKHDSEFERTSASMERTISKAPFYAIEVEPAIHHTMGGLKINSKAQVLNKKGEAIPGLFAAGEVTGGIHGAERLGGNAVADICIFGKIAGESAAHYISYSQF